MKIGFFQLEEWEEKIAEENLKEHELTFIKGKIDSLNIPDKKDFDAISLFTGSVINKDVLNYLPNLKLIATRSTGFDHIDIQACKERGVVVSYVPGYGDNTVAEFAFGLILTLSRKIYDAIDCIKEGRQFEREKIRGIDLKGKTLGVIGTGRIGKEAIKMAYGFGMKVIAFDPYPDANFQNLMKFEYVNLEKLLENSDTITIHCPYSEATHHLINIENISLIKKGALLVNTARGGIVETDALIKALKAGILRGVALDVLEDENQTQDDLELLEKNNAGAETLRIVLQNHILMKMPNVLVTPHNAFNSEEALQRILKVTIENLKGFFEGKSQNIVS